MKKIIIVHGWDATSKSDFHPWLKKELNERKIWNYFPNMPNTSEPKINEWVPFLKKNIKKINNETIIVGHSIGCQAVLRLLETLPDNIQINKCILIAPWMHLDKQTLEEEGEGIVAIARPWMETPIEWKKIRNHCNNFICIFSDNDPDVPLSNEKLFKEKLNAKIIVLHNKYHFDEGSGIYELPELLNEVLK